MLTEENTQRISRKLKIVQTGFFGLPASRRRFVFAHFFAAFVLVAAFSGAARAQVQLIFNDAAPNLETGAALSPGAVYRFRSVAPRTDALVTIRTVSPGATLTVLDDNTTLADRFQPVIRTLNANTTAYVRFDFQLVAAGTSTPRPVPSVNISAQDIDGNGVTNGIREFVEFADTRAVTIAAPTLLVSAAPLIGGTRYIQTAPTNTQAGIGTDNQYEMYTTIADTASTFTILGGNASGSAACSGTACDRQNSYAFDPLSSNVTPVPAPDVSITKTGTTSVNQNGAVTYTLVARNNGATTAHGATVTDNVPATLTGVTISCVAASGAVCPATAGLTTLNSEFIPTFPSGGQVTFTIGGTASASGTLTNTATIAAPNGSIDPSAANNTSATVTTNVTPVADLSIVKTGTSAAAVGQSVSYSLVVSNAGPANVAGAIITDNVPSNITAVSWTCAGSGTATCAAANGTGSNISLTGNINSGAANKLTVTITGTATTAGSIINTATVAAPTGFADPNCSGSPVVCTGNNTSSQATAIAGLNLTGVVFEDVNYAGGGGRSLLASGGVGRGAARVELYDSAGNFLSAAATATTGAVGQYQFTNLAAGNYTVRVVNSIVASSRTGAVSTLVGVQTFRTNGAAGDANRVGGENPLKIDAAANTTNATLSSLTTTTTAAESIGAATISNANVTSVDFGFNFDTIVNVNDSGQGSLRQFITNANALNGADTSIFMISDGAAHNGLPSGLPNQLTGGAANVILTSLLPALTDSLTTIDGATQTANVGNTNSGSLGTGGTVGVDNLPLSTVQRPEVQITDAATNLAIGLDLQGTGEIVRGIAIYGFGTAANTDASANIRLGANAANALIEQNIIGATASTFTDPGSGARSGGDNVRSAGADNGVLRG